jgi:hypothetical protein
MQPLMKVIISLFVALLTTSSVAQKQSPRYIEKFFVDALQYPNSLIGRNESNIILLQFSRKKGKDTIGILNDMAPAFREHVIKSLAGKMKSFDYNAVKDKDVLPIIFIGKADFSGGYPRAFISNYNLVDIFDRLKGQIVLKTLTIIATEEVIKY